MVWVSTTPYKLCLIVLGKAHIIGSKIYNKNMPQLDAAAYLPQVFSLIVVFSVFYAIVLKNILPTLGTILKVRAKKLSQGQDLITNMETENSKIAVEYDTILSTSLKESGQLLQNTATDSATWINETITNTTNTSTATPVLSMNTLYVKSLGDITAKKLYFATSMPRLFKNYFFFNDYLYGLGEALTLGLFQL